MFSKKTIAAGLIAVTTLTAVPANAASFGFHFGAPGWGWSPGPHHGPRWQTHRLSQREVRGILRHQGFRFIDFLDTRGPVYQVRARKHGRGFFLVVSARNGNILSMHRA